MNWQPIETAPKEGTRIVAWDRTLDTFLEIVWALVKRNREFPTEGEWQYVDTYYYDLTSKPDPSHWLNLTPPNND